MDLSILLIAVFGEKTIADIYMTKKLEIALGVEKIEEMFEKDIKSAGNIVNRYIEDSIEFLRHSNYIENELSGEALEDSVEAWIYAVSNMGRLNLNGILGIHKILMKRIRPDIAGKFRNCDVWIGGHRKMFIGEALFKEELEEIIRLMKFSNFEKGKEEEYAKHCHVLFERIHPFEDGNGRVGRILYNVHRIKLGLPIHIIHEGEEQIEYYKWFK